MANKKVKVGAVKTGGAKVRISAERPNRVEHGAMANEKSSPSIKKTNMIG